MLIHETLPVEPPVNPYGGSLFMAHKTTVDLNYCPGAGCGLRVDKRKSGLGDCPNPLNFLGVPKGI